MVAPGGECVAARTANARCETCDCIIPYLSEMQFIHFNGDTYNIPGPDYLEYLYGSDWHIPKITK